MRIKPVSVRIIAHQFVEEPKHALEGPFLYCKAVTAGDQLWMELIGQSLKKKSVLGCVE